MTDISFAIVGISKQAEGENWLDRRYAHSRHICHTGTNGAGKTQVETGANSIYAATAKGVVVAHGSHQRRYRYARIGRKKLETDRRVQNKRSVCWKKTAENKFTEWDAAQNRGELIRVALIGYILVVGKSTLMNVLSKSDVFYRK